MPWLLGCQSTEDRVDGGLHVVGERAKELMDRFAFAKHASFL